MQLNSLSWVAEKRQTLKLVESVDEATVDAQDPGTLCEPKSAYAWRYTLNVIALLGVLKPGSSTLWPHILKSL